MGNDTISNGYREPRYVHKIRFVSARNITEGEVSKNCVSFRVDLRTGSKLLRKPCRSC